MNDCTEAGGSIDRWSLYRLWSSTGSLLHDRKSQVCELSMHADWRCTHYGHPLAWERGPSVEMNSAMQRVKLGERNASCVFQHLLLHFSVYYGSWACVICVSVYVWVCICVSMNLCDMWNPSSQKRPNCLWRSEASLMCQRNATHFSEVRLITSSMCFTLYSRLYCCSVCVCLCVHPAVSSCIL